MNALSYLDAILKDQTGVDQSSLMPQKLRALFEVLRELGLDKVFEVLVMVDVDTIPELRLA
jgi:hypothetical protein